MHLENVEEDVDDVEVDVDGRKDVFVGTELQGVASHQQLDVVQQVGSKQYCPDDGNDENEGLTNPEHSHHQRRQESEGHDV